MSSDSAPAIVREFLRAFRARGVTVSLRKDGGIYVGPRALVDPAELEFIKRLRAVVVAELEEEGRVVKTPATAPAPPEALESANPKQPGIGDRDELSAVALGTDDARAMTSDEPATGSRDVLGVADDDGIMREDDEYVGDLVFQLARRTSMSSHEFWARFNTPRGQRYRPIERPPGFRSAQDRLDEEMAVRGVSRHDRFTVKRKPDDDTGRALSDWDPFRGD